MVATPHRLAFSFILGLSLSACDSGTVAGPTDPPPQPPVTQPRPETVPYRVFGGVVDGSGAAVSRAEILFLSVPDGEPRLAMTDASGRYEMTIRLAGSPQRKSTQVRVQKSGYEPAVHWLSVDPDTAASRDLRLHRIYQVAAGESVHLVVRPDDPGCGYEGYVCRRIRIASSSAGTLALEAEAPSSTTVTIVRADQEPWPATNRMSVALSASSVLAVDVSILGGTPGAPHAVTLHSRLE